MGESVTRHDWWISLTDVERAAYTSANKKIHAAFESSPTAESHSFEEIGLTPEEERVYTSRLTKRHQGGMISNPIFIKPPES